MKEWEYVWKLFAVVCSAIRWVTRRKPKRPVLLVVEDNSLDAELIQLRLNKLGYDSEIASSGEVAAGLVKHTSYAVAFVDLRLPGMPGEAVVRLLSKDAPHTNIVIVCGEPADLIGLPKEEPVVFIQKPPTVDGLRKVLSRIKM